MGPQKNQVPTTPGAQWHLIHVGRQGMVKDGLEKTEKGISVVAEALGPMHWSPSSPIYGFLWTGLSWFPPRLTYLPGRRRGARCHTWPRTAAWRGAAGRPRTRVRAALCGWSSAPGAVAARSRTARSTVESRMSRSPARPPTLPPVPWFPPCRARPPTSPHSPATQRAGGQRRRLQRMVAGGLAAGGQCVGGSVAR